MNFIVPAGEYPTPSDYSAEVETAAMIVGFCRDPSTSVTYETIGPFSPTTPWIAWQLGMAAEKAIAEGEGTVAMKLATAASYAAYICRSTEYVYINLLICGNVLLQLEHVEEALDNYQTLLRLPFPGGASPRAGAHLAMGTIYRHFKVDLRLAIYHYEHAMRFYSTRIDSAKLIAFWKNVGSLYVDSGDMVGGVLSLCQSQHPQAKTAIKEVVKGSLAKKLALRSRLLRQGNQVMAEFVKRCPL